MVWAKPLEDKCILLRASVPSFPARLSPACQGSEAICKTSEGFIPASQCGQASSSPPAPSQGQFYQQSHCLKYASTSPSTKWERPSTFLALNRLETNLRLENVLDSLSPPLWWGEDGRGRVGWETCGGGKWVGMGMLGGAGFGVSQSRPLVIPPGATVEGNLSTDCLQPCSNTLAQPFLLIKPAVLTAVWAQNQLPPVSIRKWNTSSQEVPGCLARRTCHCVASGQSLRVQCSLCFLVCQCGLLISYWFLGLS